VFTFPASSSVPLTFDESEVSPEGSEILASVAVEVPEVNLPFISKLSPDRLHQKV